MQHNTYYRQQRQMQTLPTSAVGQNDQLIRHVWATNSNDEEVENYA